MSPLFVDGASAVAHLRMVQRRSRVPGLPEPVHSQNRVLGGFFAIRPTEQNHSLWNTVQGGILLEPPKLLTEGRGLPRILTSAIGSSQLPDKVKTAIQGAIRHYDRADHLDAAIRCRSTLEIALAEVTIPRGHLAVMSERARANGVITEGVDNLCRAVAFFGGKAAHPQSRPELQVTRYDALTVICITIQVLRHLFLDTESL